MAAFYHAFRVRRTASRPILEGVRKCSRQREVCREME
jgi:hypothetical protein